MKNHPFEYRFTYRAEYVRWKGKKRRPVFLNGIQPVALVEVDPKEAPVSYKINSGGHGHRETHEVRSFNGSLWWPIFDHRLPIFDNAGPLTLTAFLALASTDWARASRVMDPMARTYYLAASSVETFMIRRRVSEGNFWPEREPQEKQAEWDASRIIICGDQVLVDAGDPVWYAVLDEAASRVDLVVGHSDLDRSHVDRPHGAGFFTPGPDRNARIACGRLSLVFGLEEISSALSTFAELGHEFRFVSEIVALSSHAPASAVAAELCVRASAQHLREIALLKPDLRKAMPELADTSRADNRTDLRSDRSLLQKFVAGDVPALRSDHARWIAEARKVLDRLATHEPLAEEDEVALSRLAI